MTSPAPVRAFSQVSAVTARSDGSFDASIDDQWTIAGKPNGGYLLAIMSRAARQAVAHPDPLATSAHYLRPPSPGPARVEVEQLRSGRSATQLRARLVQHEATCVEALMTMGRLDERSVPHWAAGVPAMPRGSFEDSIGFGTTRTDFPVPVFDQVDARLDPECLGFTKGAASGRGELRGWLALPAGEDFDVVSLQYALDAYPPATLDIAQSGWVPTLELTTYLRAVPAPGPVRVVQRAQLIQDGRVDEVCYIWDSAGRLVGQATQLAGIRFA